MSDKPREFWIQDVCGYSLNAFINRPDCDDESDREIIQVIEKSAYDELKERLREITSEWKNACERAEYKKELIQDHLELQAQADKLADALADVIYGEPPDFATKYVYADKLLKEYRGEK